MQRWWMAAIATLVAVHSTVPSPANARTPFETPHQTYDLNPGGYAWPVDVPDLPCIGDMAPDDPWFACAGRKIVLNNRTDLRKTIYVSTTESGSETISNAAKRKRLLSDISRVAPPHRARFKPYYHKYPSLEIAILGPDDEVSFVPRAATSYVIDDGDVWYVAIKAKRCA